MKHKYVCAACDFGASSGRVLRAEFDGTRVVLHEQHRFAHHMILRGEHAYWDFSALYQNLMEGLRKSAGERGLDSVGIDTWGVDFGLILDGTLSVPPMSYRDAANAAAMEEVHRMVGAEQMYARSGVANMALNTVYQLRKLQNAGMLQGKMLLMADLFGYFLSGDMRSEYTNATTTQLVFGAGWDEALIAQIGLPREMFTEIMMPHQWKGAIRAEHGLGGAKLACVPGHDTACAVACVPQDEGGVFISSGTWSLLGIVTQNPVICAEGAAGGYSNYGAAEGGMLLKDIMGMWIINECKRQWNKQDAALGFSEIVTAAQAARTCRAWIDPDDEVFFDAPDMIGAVQARCFGDVPQTVGEVARCVFESLAMKYRHSIERLEYIVQKPLTSIYMVGGGIQNEFLCQLVADVCGRECICGPVEATGLGNVLSQLAAAGEITQAQMGDVLQASFARKVYVPREDSIMEEAYIAFARMMQ